MKILHFSTYDNVGGAGRAVSRLHRGLLSLNVDSKIVVQTKCSDDPEVIQFPSHRCCSITTPIREGLERTPARLLYPNKTINTKSFNWVSRSFTKMIREHAPNIIHLHWIGAGFFPIREISKIKVPMVWTLHDSWTFTGCCHVPSNCVRYNNKCGRCPQLGSSFDFDISRILWLHKFKHIAKSNIHIVCPSNWLANAAKNSLMLRNKRIEIIPNGIDTSIFRPIDKIFCREALGLPVHKKIVVFGAVGATSDRNKGFHLLQPALERIVGQLGEHKLHLAVFGASHSNNLSGSFDCNLLGVLRDDITLAMIYSAADVVVVPSLQEAFGQTASEAMACGTPVVAFGATGLLDIVEHLVNGYLAKPYEPLDLANGILYVLEDDDRWKQLSTHARQKILNSFDLPDISQIYKNIYNSLIYN